MAKGDDLDLKADLDGGFARVSNLLLEALCAADLSVSELKTVLFVIRRTYGWARDRDPRYKADTITAQEVARGTGLSLSTVRDALRELRTKQVLLRAPGEPGAACMWGINTDISTWGAESAVWDAFRSRFQDVKALGVYHYSNTPAAGQDPLGSAHPSCGRNTPPLADAIPPLLRTQYPPSCAANTPPLADAIGCRDQTPRAPGAPVAPTESFTESYTESLTEKAPPPAGDGPEESDSEPSSQRQTAFGDTAWQAHGLPLPCPKKVVSAARFFVKRHGKRGADLLLASWASTRDGCTVPDGADPEEHIADKIRSAAQRDFEWDPQKQRAGKGKPAASHGVGKHTKTGRVTI